MAAGDKKASQFTAIATLASSDTFVAVDTSESDLRTATGTVVLAWIGASLDMSTIASGGALPVAYGGSGRATGTTAYSLVATGTTATGAQQTLANGATTEVLVGGGASALPVWTTATGTGAPVRATSPTLVTPAATSLACPTFTTASGAMGFTPAAGSNFNITLSTTGDFAVNTSQLYVDTSAGSVGFGTTTPTATTHTYTLRTNTTKSAALTFGSFSDIDLTNDDSTTYQTVAVVGTVRYRGTSSESGSAKGQRAFDANVFIYNTGTTTDAGGFRLEARNLSTGTVTNLYGTWLPVAVNSGGGTVTNLYGHKVDAQTVGVNNFGYWSNIAAGTGRWNFYAAGTANNYFAGNVGIGTATFGTSAAKVLGIANGTAPSSSPADMVQLYAEDVSSYSELKVRDEGGTVTVLSPHPWDAPDKLKFLGHGLDEYSASKNMYRGECYWFNRSKFYFDDTATKADCRMIETFAEYNKRRGLAKGDKGYLEVEDWDDNQLRQESEVAAEVPKAKEHNASIRKHKRGVDKGEPADLPTPYRRKSKPEWL